MLFLVFVFAPAVGVAIRKNQKWKRAIMFLMCFSTIGGFFQAAEWGFTIHPIEYRGTARGFHLFAAELLAVILIWGQMTANWKGFKFLPPGMKLYLLYCFASLLSLINAPVPLYAWFAAVKAIKMSVIFIAIFNSMREEEDLRVILRSLAVTMFWQCLVVVKMKYLDHIHQAYGTFEHQNSLAMFTTLIGMVFLAVALGPSDRSSNFYLGAYIACGVIIQCTLSRGGLAVFAGGTLAVILTSLMERVTRRRVAVLASIAAVGTLGLAFTMDSIVARFNEYGTQESKNTRDMLNKASAMMLRDYPLGVGWNNFAHTINYPYHYGNHIDYWHKLAGNPVDKTYKKGVVESLWWLLLAETGYQGLITYVLVLLAFLWWNLRSMIFFKHQYLGAVSTGIFWGTAMCYSQSFLERILTQPRNMMLWLILLAVTAKIEFLRRQVRKQRRMNPQARRQHSAPSRRVSEPELQPA